MVGKGLSEGVLSQWFHNDIFHGYHYRVDFRGIACWYYRIVHIISPCCIISPPSSSAQSSCVGIGRIYIVYYVL